MQKTGLLENFLALNKLKGGGAPPVEIMERIKELPFLEKLKTHFQPKLGN